MSAKKKAASVFIHKRKGETIKKNQMREVALLWGHHIKTKGDPMAAS